MKKRREEEEGENACWLLAPPGGPVAVRAAGRCFPCPAANRPSPPT